LDNVKSKKWFLDKISKLLNVEDLPQLLDEVIHRNPLESMDSGHFLQHNFPQTLIDNLDEIGWDHFVSINQDFTHLILSLQDDKRRSHLIDITLSQDYPLVPPVISLSLPFVVKLDWKPNHTLQYVVDTIQGHLSHYSNYFDVRSHFILSLN
jgi:hypothetical protein